MTKEEYITITKERLEGNSLNIMLNQIDRFYNAKEYTLPLHNYKVGDEVLLNKGTLLHGTYKNIEGLREIVNNGLVSSWFIDGRNSKYPSSVGVWNLKQDYKLKDYINFYSGGTILYAGIYENNTNTQTNKTSIIPYDKMNSLLDEVKKINCHMWTLEQTKEARFMPSLIQDRVQIGIIFNSNNVYTKELSKGDILSNAINDEDVKPFINQNYYEKFIKERKNKDDLFTDRESAILFGIPSNLIEGILVGREYEKNIAILFEIKNLLPNAYICNLDGKVILI